MEDEEILYTEQCELLVIFRSRSRAPYDWTGVTGGLPYRGQLTPQGYVLVITTNLLEEARRLLRSMNQRKWGKEVTSPLIRKKVVQTKWMPVPPGEWATDYFEQQPPMIESPFLQSLGVLPAPTLLSHKELPAGSITDKDVADGQLYQAPDEQDLDDDERRSRLRHRKLEHDALLPTHVLRKEAEDEAAYKIRVARAFTACPTGTAVRLESLYGSGGTEASAVSRGDDLEQDEETRRRW